MALLNLTLIHSALYAKFSLNMTNQLYGLGSDGASVMLGARGRVAKLLKDKVPFLVSKHCTAHRLALVCGQAANEIPYLKRFKSVPDELYRFHSNSTVRTTDLHLIQEVFDDSYLNFRQAKYVKWKLSKCSVFPNYYSL